MKRLSKLLFHLLGGVHFAVTLIGMTAFFVIVGTLIESKTESHRYAAFYTYRHPAFITLLAFFFVNILFAALRRFPFKRFHIPFLLTHLGLLMIISGTIIKQIYGVQGAMHIMEGSASHEIAINETHSVRIDKRDPQDSTKRLRGDYDLIHRHSPFPELEIELIGYAPNSSEQWETWIKSPYGSITGLKPLQAFSWKGFPEPIPVSARVRFFPEPEKPWNVHVLNVQDKAKAIEDISKTFSNHSGTGALALIKDLNEECALFALHPSGKTWNQDYKSKNLDTLLVYDEGFGGYSAFANISFDGEESFSLETQIALKLTTLEPLKKMEENISRVTLKLKRGEKEEILSLPHDRHGWGLKWPAMDGEYLLRYQSKLIEIPFHVRLRTARQINYPGSNQPYSFESDLKITDRLNGSYEESTISMNQVHETANGYRFYLSSITPSNESDVKRIQLIVNYDPAKYWLTYPGGLLITFGIILLFWRKPKSFGL